MKKGWIECFLLVIFTCNTAMGQQASTTAGESHKYRTTLTLAGAGGGFTVGLLAGLAAFDDSVNSDRKVWTTAVPAGIGGAIGGYLLGRSLDKRSKRTDATWNAETVRTLSEASRLPGLRAEALGTTPSSKESPILQSYPVMLPAATSEESSSVLYLDHKHLYLVSAIQSLEGATN